MAKEQTEMPKESVESLLEKANAYSQTTVPINKIENIDLSNVTDDELRRECKEGLVLLVRNNKGKLAALAAIRELLNRIDGTPAQTLKIDASVAVKASILPPAEAKQRIALIEEEIRRRSMIDVTPVKLIE